MRSIGRASRTAPLHPLLREDDYEEFEHRHRHRDHVTSAIPICGGWAQADPASNAPSASTLQK
jgi:hypothetical protein